jgi:hypothetical protein
MCHSPPICLGVAAVLGVRCVQALPTAGTPSRTSRRPPRGVVAAVTICAALPPLETIHGVETSAARVLRTFQHPPRTLQTAPHTPPPRLERPGIPFPDFLSRGGGEPGCHAVEAWRITVVPPRKPT